MIELMMFVLIVIMSGILYVLRDIKNEIHKHRLAIKHGTRQTQQSDQPIIPIQNKQEIKTTPKVSELSPDIIAPYIARPPISPGFQRSDAGDSSDYK